MQFHSKKIEMLNYIRFLPVVLVLLLFSCSNTKYLPEGEKLYTGADAKIVPVEKMDGLGDIRNEVDKLLLPQPNSKILGLRIKLWIHNIAPTPKRKGLSYWLKYKVGEEAVLYSRVNPDLISQYIDSRLFNKGIFRAHTTYTVKETEKKASVHYNISVHKRYKFGKVSWPEEQDTLSKEIKLLSAHSRIRTGINYDLVRLEEERERIDEKLKDKGFFYYNADYVLFQADTNNENKTVNIRVTVKRDIPSAASQIYHLNEIYVTPDFTLRKDSLTIRKDTVDVDSIHWVYADAAYRPKPILRSVFLRKGDTYSRVNHEMTLKRLMGMNVFKFVNVRFSPPDSFSTGILNANVLLTPLPRKSIKADFEVTSKSNNFIGPGLTLSYSNRNAFSGAELLTVNLHTSFETQFYGEYEGMFSYEVGPEINLYVPRLMIPFYNKRDTGYYIPKTRYTVGFDFQRRVQYFDLKTFTLIYGYKWKKKLLVDHELDPLNVTYSLPSNQSPEFLEMLEDNELLRKSFDEQFIVGPSYSFTYNEQVIERKRNQTYFNLNLSTSGNIISYFSKLVLGNYPSVENPLKLFGTIYSQFVRIDTDLRHYRRLSRKTKLTGRFYAGIGVPYMNSAALPYVKQFFSGGVSSVRAFRARALGPGTYYNEESLSNSDYFEQGGDIKLEANIELRFPFLGMLKGAIFTDAGNIWLVNENPSIPGGKFTSDFMNEIAVGSGFGLRFDADFFVLRFDLAFPLRKPWLPDGERWVVNKISWGNQSWRNENLLLNIAIGYPF